ncbi:MAG: hypothetical protein HY056_11410 [Proteobacteria bacterium]|nr:hypothetical protein [Pseudomonadota bacterium]
MNLYRNCDRQLATLHEMFDRLSIDPAVAGQPALAGVFAATVRACQYCDVGDACRDWLFECADGAGEAPAFCRNYERLAILRGAGGPSSRAA